MQKTDHEHFQHPSPFQRRYQVFVSSTYEDLKDERRHVIQALLETKCIPSGMELFPAASTEQWSLIKRVIDESDYYVVIVAGRYGSSGPDGKSYTEMEFDYAVETLKPILGFYHENPQDLPGSKLEKTDAGKTALAQFSQKVKSKLCRPWRTAEALGSAIKSAIISEIEFNPQPGWVKASAAIDPMIIQKLKQRIADLETTSKASTTSHLPQANAVFHASIELKSKPKGSYSGPISVTREFDVEWQYLFQAVTGKLLEPMARSEIRTILKEATLQANHVTTHELIPEGHQLVSSSLDKATLSHVLDILLSDGLIAATDSRHFSYRLTPAGHRIAAQQRLERKKNPATRAR